MDALSVRYEELSIAEDHSYLKENNQIYKGEDNINNYLDKLAFELEHERSISGDACYLDPHSGEVC